jgi:ABC-type multidrug transport system fused ATPase/permease subunit
LGKYALYAVGEIFLVVVGILIALQINNWNLQKIERKEELKTYRNIKQQIQDDLKELTELKAFNQLKISEMERANQIIADLNTRAIDTLAYITIMMSQFSDFNGNGTIYETLVNSGDIKLLSNEEIPLKIKRLENTYNYINHLEELHWSIIIEEFSPEMRGVMNYSSFQILKPNKLYSPELQNIIFEVNYLSQGKDSIYGRAIREIHSIDELLNTELELK